MNCTPSQKDSRDSSQRKDVLSPFRAELDRSVEKAKYDHERFEDNVN
jgi:hypothetical protein